MKKSRAPLVAWTLFGIIALSVLLQAGLDLAKPGAGGNAFALLEPLLWDLVLVVFALVAALIISRQPRNVIGWLLMCPAIAAAIPAASYIAAYPVAPARVTPLLLLALWFGNWSWLLLIFPILFIPVLFPTGRPLSARWRWIIFAGLGMSAVLVFFATFAAKTGPTSGSQDGAWTVPNPIGFLPEGAFPMLLWVITLGVLTLASAASLFMRYRRAAGVERAQIRWLLYASAVFAAVYVPELLISGKNTPLDHLLSFLFPLALMLIPIAIAIAILRHNVWGIDLIIRRTLVYVPLTAVLAGVFAASSKVLQTFFAALTGSQSQAATVLTTLIIVAAFEPIKRWLQKIVDARFKEAPDPEARWKAFGEQVRTFVQMNDPVALVSRLLEEAVAVFDLKGGAVTLQEAGEMRQVHAIGDWNAPGLAIPLEHQGTHIGHISLGVRRSGRPFEAHDLEILGENANAVAAAIVLLGRDSARETGLPP
jgi:hypothetical protein